MKKRDLERQQRQFQGNTNADATALRARVSQDLNVVKDAYDVGSIAIVELSKQFANIQFSDKPVKELADLARAYADISKTLVLLRAEGRTTIAEAVAGQATPDQAPDADPPAPESAGGARGTTTPDKISLAHKALSLHVPTLSIGDAFENSED